MTSIKLLDRGLPLKLEWLRSLLAVAGLRSFTKAAHQLHLSQPTVWTHVRLLEANLNTKLFEYVGSRSRPTRAGEIAAREARRVLDEVKSFRDAVVDSEVMPGGMVSLGASTTPGNYILPAVMHRFELRHAPARTNLTIGNSATVLQRLREGAVDLALVGMTPVGTEFNSRVLCTDEIVPFVSRGHRLARRRKPSLQDFAKERLVVREPDSATRRLLDHFLESRQIHPALMQLGCPETVKRAVAAGLGIGILSRHSISSEIRQGEFSTLESPGFPIRRKLYSVYLRRKHMSRLMVGFLDLLHNETETSGRRSPT